MVTDVNGSSSNNSSSLSQYQQQQRVSIIGQQCSSSNCVACMEVVNEDAAAS